MRQLSCKLAAQIAREVVGFWDKVDKLISRREASSLELQQKAELEQQLGEYVTIYWNAVLT